MPRPQYPTAEGLWSRGKRGEAGYGAVRLGTPYPAAVENLRGAECCHFVVERLGECERKNPWHAYSEELMRRAIQKLSKAEHPGDE